MGGTLPTESKGIVVTFREIDIATEEERVRDKERWTDGLWK